MDYLKPDIDRLLAAYARKKHDRVPNFEVSIDPEALQRIMGWDAAMEVVRSDMMDPASQVLLARKACQDAILCNVQYWPGAMGSIVSRDDLERLPDPDPAALRRKGREHLDAAAGTGIGVGLMMAGPHFTAYCTIGPHWMESFMYAYYDDPGLITDTMDRQLEGQLRVVEALEGMPFSFVEIADDLADNRGLMLSRDFFDEIWYPRMERLVREIRGRLNVPVQFHCCGNLRDVLPYAVRLGVDAITPIQANCNDIYKIKKEYGDRLCLAGNMAIDGVLAYGTPEEVAADTKAHIDGLSGDGGYVCASSHSICNSIPADNYFAMIRTAQTYGIFR